MKSQKGFGIAGWLVAIVAVAGLAGAGWYVWDKNKDEKPVRTSTGTQPTPGAQQKASFANPKKGAHFETSTPEHASTLATVPVDVVINFNFDLAGNSKITIEKDGKDYGVGGTSFDSNKLTMRRQMDQTAPDGVYTVKYDGCWPDKTCHDGHFQFAVDRGLLRSYQDMKGQKTITIKMSQIKFQPMNLRVSPGTQVTWVNDDAEIHYVNTDSHPAHTHVPSLNSKALAKGQSYSFTFDKVGAYPYHCSAHAADMTGSLVVES